MPCVRGGGCASVSCGSFSGAEIEGLVKSAASYAFALQVQVDNIKKVEIEKLKVCGACGQARACVRGMCENTRRVAYCEAEHGSAPPSHKHGAVTHMREAHGGVARGGGWRVEGGGA